MHCAGSQADPRLSAGADGGTGGRYTPRSPGDYAGDIRDLNGKIPGSDLDWLVDLLQTYGKAYAEYQDATFDYWGTAADYVEGEASEEEFLKAAERLKATREEAKRQEEALAGDIALEQDKNGGQKQRVAEGGRDVCGRVSDMVASCNRARWATAPCQLFLDSLHNCPTTEAYVDPGSDQPWCRNLAPEAGSVREAAVLACQSVTRTAPGEDPCQRVNVRAEQSTVWLRDRYGAPCSDPAAYCSGDPEQDSFTFTQILPHDMDGGLLPDAWTTVLGGAGTLGGPVVVVPEPSPFPANGGH
jgi:hypothetical protein